MLEALLPQVAELGDLVEVWVIDNSSTDTTPDVVAQARTLGPFKSVRNDSNLGPLRNILKGACELASGQYVWILGDHNLFRPGSLKALLEDLSAHANVAAFYVNFSYASWPGDWPETALGGFENSDGPVANPSQDERLVAAWNELLQPATALCTQCYVHIVKTEIWKHYWRDKPCSEPYCDSLTTYPHTRMLVDTLFHCPAFYIGRPAITIFNGVQSWGDPKTALRVFLYGLPDLLSVVRRAGLEKPRLADCLTLFCRPQTERVLQRAITHLGFLRVFRSLVASRPGQFYVWQSFFDAWLTASDDAAARVSRAVREAVKTRHQWWIVNCRVARWLRRVFSRSF
jgi:hypothetical protein